MVAGVPGAGISAFFYLLAVLAMPFVAVFRATRSRSMAAGRWSLVARQVGVGLGIAVGLVVGGALVTLLVASGSPAATAEQTAQAAWQMGSTLSRVGLAVGLVTLVLVMGTVQVAAWVVARRSRGADTGPEVTGLEPV